MSNKPVDLNLRKAIDNNACCKTCAHEKNKKCLLSRKECIESNVCNAFKKYNEEVITWHLASTAFEGRAYFRIKSITMDYQFTRIIDETYYDFDAPIASTISRRVKTWLNGIFKQIKKIPWVIFNLNPEFFRDEKIHNFCFNLGIAYRKYQIEAKFETNTPQDLLTKMIETYLEIKSKKYPKDIKKTGN